MSKQNGKIKYPTELLHILIPAFRSAYQQTYEKHNIPRYKLDILAQAIRLSKIQSLYFTCPDVINAFMAPGNIPQTFYKNFRELVSSGYFRRVNKGRRWNAANKYEVTGSGIQIIDNFARLLRKELSKQTFHDFFPQQSIHTI